MVNKAKVYPVGQRPEKPVDKGKDDLCHGKTWLKIFVVGISKEGFAGSAPNPSLGMTPTMKL